MKLSLIVVAATAVCLIGENGTAFAPLAAPTMRSRSSAASPRAIHSRQWAKSGGNDPLATEGDWSAFLDRDNTGMVYYFNTKTGESRWEAPTDTFPSVSMDEETRKVAREKRAAYLEQVENEEDQPKKKGFLASILDKPQEKKEEVVVKDEKEDEAKWFDGLFDKKPNEQQQTSTESVVVEPEPVDAYQDESKEETGFLRSLFRKTSNGADASKTREIPKRGVADKVFAGPTPLTLDAASYVLPHPAKVSWGGEDAVFVKGRSFGVFDGVSGADKLDGIPLFSFTLADEMMRTMNEDGATMKEMIKSLADASDFGYRAATGASTALVASVGKDDYLRVLNLGDCSCFVIRDDKVVAKSKEIVHYFDCPYQLSEDSPDRAQDGTRLNFEVLPGDTIVMGSDGVFDNLDDDVICETVSSSPPKSNVITKRIVDRSRQVSLDDNAATPYAKLAKRNGFEDFQSGRGGKVDDVSCIVVRCT